MNVVATFPLGLDHFYRNAMGIGPGILANAGDLPGNFHTRLTASDLEAVVLNLLGDVNGGETADAGELIAEVAVERLEPFGKVDYCFAVRVEHDVAVVD